MVKPINSGLEFSLPPSSSQIEIIGERRIPRRLHRIDNKQKALLEQAHAWAQNLSRQQKPGVNLPAEVLETIRSFHRRQMETASHVPSQVSAAEESLCNDQNEAISEPSSREAGFERDSGDDEEDIGTPIPWSQTPSPQCSPKAVQPRLISQSPSAPQSSPSQAGAHPPRFPSQSREPERHTEGQHKIDTEQLFVSQISARSPLQPTLDGTNVQKKLAFNDFPSSSLGMEEELEMVAPAAFTKHIAAANKVVGLNPTPPSAQVQVPSTFEAPNSSVTEASPKKRQERPRSISMAKVLQRAAASTKMASTSLAAARMVPPKPNPPPGFEDTQSTADSSDSIIPATRPSLSSMKPPEAKTIESTIKETPSIPRSLHLQPYMGSSPGQSQDTVYPSTQDLPRKKFTDNRPVSPRFALTSPEARPSFRSGQHSSPEMRPFSPPAPDLEPEAPFIEYSVSYPSYIGSVGDFINACISIQYLQRKRALASYQYDDFIRAWYQGYLPYIKNLDPNDTPLTAIEWYMETVEEPLCLAKIVTKENLESILTFYADEVRKFHHSSDVLVEQPPASSPTRPSPEPAPKPDFEPGPDTYREVSQPVEDEALSVVPIITRHPQRPKTVAEDHEMEVPNVPPLPSPPQRRESRTHSVYTVPSNADKHAMTHPPSTPATSKSSARKRPSGDDFVRPAPKKLASNVSLPPSDNGSVVSDHSSASRYTAQPPASGPPRSTGPFQRRRRKDQDPDAKFQRWQAFLARRKPRGSDNISIASSAPVSATPTSGQKE
ncbi:hypothetical protein BJ170DRAFT_628436 [Xylariales sp. AK1849]|nr:hypothetical protein BJ170DRAFT_628436 [Xylariales sp. AK1849]